MDCTVSGPLPNRLIDPTNSANSRCELSSFSLFGQTVNAPIGVIYGENGDETDEHVRLGARLRGTHAARLAKSAGENCGATFGPVARLNTSFAGRHIARIDKMPARACVLDSRLDLDRYDQTTTLALSIDTSATRETVRDALARRLDLELATAVNRLLRPNLNVNARAFVNAAGRCPGYRTFSGN